MATGSGITVVVDAQNKTAQAMGAAAKGVKTVGEAADVAQRQLTQMDRQLEDANVKAARMALAQERAAEKTRRLAQDLALAKRELAENGDKTGDLSRKIDRMTIDLRLSTRAMEDQGRAANRAAADVRELGRGYDKVADNARQAARAVTLLGAATLLFDAGAAAKAERASARAAAVAAKAEAKAAALAAKTLGFGASLSEGLLKNGFGGGAAAVEGALGTPVVGPALLGAGIVAGAGAATFAGAAAGGGIGLGLGAGAAGAGLAGAWMGDPTRYGDAWDKVAERFKTRWISASRAFGDELDGVLKTADQTLSSINVEKALGVSQRFVNPLAQGIGGGASSAANGAIDSLAAWGPTIDRIGPKIADFGHDVGDMFRMIAIGAEGGGHALGDLIDLLGFMVKAIGVGILAAETLYEGLRDLAEGGAKAYRELSPLGGLIEDWAGDFLHVDSSAEQLGRSLGTTAAEADGMGGAILGGIGAFNEATFAADAYNDALSALRETQLAMANANVAVAQGWLNLREELNDGAKTLDLNTQAGIDNEKAIINQVAALERQRQQAIETGNHTVEATEAANAAYARQVEQIRQAAYAAGFDKQKVDELIASLGNVPPTVNSEVKVKGLAESLGQGISLGNALNRIDGQSYNANVYVAYHTKGQSLNAGLRTGGLPHAAAGGAQGRDTVVGEDGIEVVRLPTGSTVYPKANAGLMLGGRGGGAQTSAQVIELHIIGNGGLAQMLMEMQRAGDLKILSRAIVK